jgi:rRNA-processing protein FCF1
MAHDAEMMAIPPAATKPAIPSAAAERMRRLRERRRDGLRCLTIELRETEIDALVCMGLLKIEMRNDANAIIEALYDYFDRTLDLTP